MASWITYYTKGVFVHRGFAKLLLAKGDVITLFDNISEDGEVSGSTSDNVLQYSIENRIRAIQIIVTKVVWQE